MSVEFLTQKYKENCYLEVFYHIMCTYNYFHQPSFAKPFQHVHLVLISILLIELYSMYIIVWLTIPIDTLGSYDAIYLVSGISWLWDIGLAVSDEVTAAGDRELDLWSCITTQTGRKLWYYGQSGVRISITFLHHPPTELWGLHCCLCFCNLYM